MKLEQILNAGTIGCRATMLIELGKLLARIDADIERCEKDKVVLEDKERTFSVSFSQVGNSTHVNPDNVMHDQLRTACIDFYRQRISELSRVRLDLCRVNRDEKTNGEVWMEEHANKEKG